MGDMVPRKTREQRAFRLAVTGGSLAVLAVVGFILALAGVVGFGIPLIAAAVAGLCYFFFRRSVGM